MTWKDKDNLDERWLPEWSVDDIPPQDPPPMPAPDEPPESPLSNDEGPECRVNLALWWLALLADGAPPSGDWVDFLDQWDADTPHVMGYEAADDLDDTMGEWGGWWYDDAADLLENFRMNDGPDDA